MTTPNKYVRSSLQLISYRMLLDYIYRRGNKMTKLTTQQSDCKICRKVNDGICSNFCLMDKSQKQKYIKDNQHLFRNSDKGQSIE